MIDWLNLEHKTASSLFFWSVCELQTESELWRQDGAPLPVGTFWNTCYFCEEAPCASWQTVSTSEKMNTNVSVWLCQMGISAVCVCVFVFVCVRDLNPDLGGAPASLSNSHSCTPSPALPLKFSYDELSPLSRFVAFYFERLGPHPLQNFNYNLVIPDLCRILKLCEVHFFS